MAKADKQRCELLMPSENGWTLWAGLPGGRLEREQSFESAGAFSREGQFRQLALPAANVWVLPAWIKGDVEHLRDMSLLHLERAGVRCSGSPHEFQVTRIAADDTANLACIIALKDQPAPLGSRSVLPDIAAVSAACYPLADDAITVWRELGKLVAAITSGGSLVYFSPLSSTRLDDAALSELNNVCLQLSFQRVIGKIERIVLWMEGADAVRIRRSTGIEARIEDKPAPQLCPAGASALMPADIITDRENRKKSARTRMMALTAGAVAAAVVAVFAGLTALASRERDALLDRVAELSPRASKVADHRKIWEEVAAAIDPKRFPMDILLRCMEPKCSGDIMLTQFECSPEFVMLRGRAQPAATALQYTQEIKSLESLAAYAWDGPPPEFGQGGEDSASFELKGTRP